MTYHRCHAESCTTLLSPRTAFCSRHARMLPLMVHSRLLAASYRGGGADYDEALRAAISTVASRERVTARVA